MSGDGRCDGYLRKNFRGYFPSDAHTGEIRINGVSDEGDGEVDGSYDPCDFNIAPLGSHSPWRRKQGREE